MVDIPTDRPTTSRARCVEDKHLIQLSGATLPETNIAPKMVVSNRNLLFQGSIFRSHVSFREGISVGYSDWAFIKVVGQQKKTNKCQKIELLGGETFRDFNPMMFEPHLKKNTKPKTNKRLLFT